MENWIQSPQSFYNSYPSNLALWSEWVQLWPFWDFSQDPVEMLS